MSAAAGDFVTPGNSVSIPEGASLGTGVHETGTGVVATVSGTVVDSSGTISFEPAQVASNLLMVDADLIVEVTTLMPTFASVRLLAIVKAGVPRALSALVAPLNLSASPTVHR